MCIKTSQNYMASERTDYRVDEKVYKLENMKKKR